MDYITIACRCLIGLVLAVAVAGKLRGPAAFRTFAGWLVTTKLVPWRWRYAVASVLVGAELLALGLLFVTPGPLAALALFAGLAGGVALALRRGAQTPCQCFGAKARPLSRIHVLRNVFLAAVAGLSLAAGPLTDVPLAGAALAVATAVVLALLVIRLDDLVELLRPRYSAGTHPS